MTSSAPTTVAFFGATGGVANAALIHTINAGYKAAALVRTPSKLRDQLTSQGVDQSRIDSHLTIVEGNALDVAAVKRTLTAAAASATGLPPFVVTGLGAAPFLQFSWRGHFANLDDPTLCETAAQVLLTAMGELYAERPELKTQKPLLTFVSTTGITRGPEDVPFWLRFLYHTILAIPHQDKRKMENLYRGDAEKADRLFRNVVGIRPTLLTGTASYSDAAGLAKVRSGTEPHPALGWTIKRSDVGHWIFENVINEKQRNPDLEGQMISLAS